MWENGFLFFSEISIILSLIPQKLSVYRGKRMVIDVFICHQSIIILSYLSPFTAL